MIPFLFLLIAYYIVNATVPLTIPLQISPNAVGTATTAPTTAPTTQSILGLPLDAATISGLVGLATTFIYRWKKTDTKQAVTDTRQTIQTQTTAKVADSLKDSDYGNKEIVNLLAGVVDQLPTLSQDIKDKVKTAADEWNSDVAALYEKQTTKPTDMSSDPIVRKLGEVQKQTERNQ